VSLGLAVAEPDVQARAHAAVEVQDGHALWVAQVGVGLPATVGQHDVPISVPDGTLR
jgi:hypothetical protein